MKISIEFRCDNAAFVENGTATEALFVLKQAEEAITDGEVYKRLLDSNGNPVGQMTVSRGR